MHLPDYYIIIHLFTPSSAQPYRPTDQSIFSWFNNIFTVSAMCLFKPHSFPPSRTQNNTIVLPSSSSSSSHKLILCLLLLLLCPPIFGPSPLFILRIPSPLSFKCNATSLLRGKNQIHPARITDNISSSSYSTSTTRLHLLFFPFCPTTKSKITTEKRTTNKNTTTQHQSRTRILLIAPRVLLLLSRVNKSRRSQTLGRT